MDFKDISHFPILQENGSYPRFCYGKMVEILKSKTRGLSYIWDKPFCFSIEDIRSDSEMRYASFHELPTPLDAVFAFSYISGGYVPACEDFESLNRSGFFLWDATSLFMAFYVINHIYDAQAEDKDTFRKPSMEDLFFYGPDTLAFMGYDPWDVAEIFPEDTLLPDKHFLYDTVISLIDSSKRDDGTADMVETIKERLNLSEMPQYLFEYILPDILEILFYYNCEVGDGIFLYWFPNEPDIENLLLSHMHHDNKAEQLYNCLQVLKSPVMVEDIWQIESAEGYLLYGKSSLLEDGISGVNLTFILAAEYFEKHYPKWLQTVKKSVSYESQEVL